VEGAEKEAVRAFVARFPLDATATKEMLLEALSDSRRHIAEVERRLAERDRQLAALKAKTPARRISFVRFSCAMESRRTRREPHGCSRRQLTPDTPNRRANSRGASWMGVVCRWTSSKRFATRRKRQRASDDALGHAVMARSLDRGQVLAKDEKK
jgi:hypothetical protein